MISVIMLTYNRENFVPRAIESILGQTYRDFEFIIVDNGSADRSGQIADEYAVKDNRVRVIHRERGSIGAGRNTGLDVALGEYITFIDDDDYAEPGLLEHLHDLAVSYSADIAVCGSWREVGGVRQPKYMFDGIFTYNGEDAVTELLKREKFNAGTPTKLIRENLFKNFRYNHSRKYDDIEMTYKLFASAAKVVVSGEPLYICTRHRHNNSRGTTSGEVIPAGQVDEYLAAFRERTRWLTERFPDKADYWFFTELSYALSMYDKVSESFLRKRLGKYVSSHLSKMLSNEKYFSLRDKELIQKYREDLSSECKKTHL